MKTKKELFVLFPDVGITPKVKNEVTKDHHYYVQTLLDFVGYKEGVAAFDVITVKRKTVTGRKRHFVTKEDFIRYDLDRGTKATTAFNSDCASFIGDYKKAHRALNDLCKTRIKHSQMKETKVASRLSLHERGLVYEVKQAHVKETVENHDQMFKKLKKIPEDFVNFCMKNHDGNIGFFDRETGLCSCPSCKGLYPLSEFSDLKNNSVGTHKKCNTVLKYRSQKLYKRNWSFEHFAFLDNCNGVAVLRGFCVTLGYPDETQTFAPEMSIRESFRFEMNEKGFIANPYEFRADYGLYGWLETKPTGIGWNRRDCSTPLHRCKFYNKYNSKELKMMNVERETFNLLAKTHFQNSFKDSFENIYRLCDIFCFSSMQDIKDLVNAKYKNTSEVVETIIHKIDCYGFRRYYENPIFKDSSKAVIERVLNTKDILKRAKTDICSLNLIDKNYDLKTLSVEEIAFLHNVESSFVGFDLKKLMSYIKEHQISKLDYKDYIRMAQDVIYNKGRNVPLWPTDFKAAHDELASLVKRMISERDEARFADISGEWNDLLYSNDEYEIVTPKNCEDIVVEGLIQNTCVSSYIDDVLMKESIILFLRKISQKDKPFITIELRNGNIVQARGKANTNIEKVDEAAYKFLVSFSEKKAIPFGSNYNGR